ncbi:putative nucleic acid-binding protein [Clostridium tetanomorphum]|nr:putative nucleic acid-binding protein [Clostridium tetanomorphum]NRS85362.1 putative nucleic acid-binding protein [Clostridium tetanomorphum]NRZ98539.1 putative nucleic acid-binding protein [Clostridium tetanomorphum]
MEIECPSFANEIDIKIVITNVIFSIILAYSTDIQKAI